MKSNISSLLIIIIILSVTKSDSNPKKSTKLKSI